MSDDLTQVTSDVMKEYHKPKDKYLIVYLIKGEAKKYYDKIVKDVASRFNIKGLPYAPAHITLKYDFTSNLKEVENLIKKFTGVSRKQYLELKGFDTFTSPQKVFFIKILPSKGMINLREELVSKLKSLNLEWSKFDNNMHYHTTIIGYYENFDEISKYIRTNYNPLFKLELDNISILKLNQAQTQWETYKEYPIR